MTNRHVAFWLILLGIGVSFWQSNRHYWLDKYDTDYWQDAFNDSQIVRGDRARNFLSDYDVYAIVGYKYWHGDNSLQLHTEAPPLGKELIGLSIELFGNQNVISLLLGVGSLGLVYLLANRISGKTLPGLATVLLLTVDPQFREMLITSNLDIQQLFWLLVSINCFLAGLKNPKWFWGANLALGFFMVTKIYFSGLVIFSVYIGYLFLQGKFDTFLNYVTSLFFVIIGYVIPYIPGLIVQPDVLGFIRFQRWLTDWWAGSAQAAWGGIFLVLFTGRWYTWWDKAVIQLQTWNILWPVAVILAGISVTRRTLLVWMVTGMLLLFFSFTSFFPRYLVLVLPFIYLLMINVIYNLRIKNEK